MPPTVRAILKIAGISGTFYYSLSKEQKDFINHVCENSSFTDKQKKEKIDVFIKDIKKKREKERIKKIQNDLSYKRNTSFSYSNENNQKRYEKCIQLFKEGKSKSEIAKHLRVKIDTIYSYLQKARKKGDL